MTYTWGGAPTASAPPSAQTATSNETSADVVPTPTATEHGEGAVGRPPRSGPAALLARHIDQPDRTTARSGPVHQPGVEDVREGREPRPMGRLDVH